MTDKHQPVTAACNCATYGNALTCPIHTQADFEASPAASGDALAQASAILTAYAVECERDFPDDPQIAEGVRMARSALWDARNGLRAAAASLPEGLDVLLERVRAEPFFPNNDGPRHGNAAAFRDYQRRVIRIIESVIK